MTFFKEKVTIPSIEFKGIYENSKAQSGRTPRINSHDRERDRGGR